MGDANTPRRNFDKQFKLDAVRLTTEGGRKVAEVARDLGILRKHPAQLARGSSKIMALTPSRGKGRLTPAQRRASPLAARACQCQRGARHPKKSVGHLFTTAAMKYQFIHDWKDVFRLRSTCVGC
ncbi:MAG: transposase [Acidobacteriota bacterium]